MNELRITDFPRLDYAATEAINTLCTNLSFVDADVKRIMITSCQAAEGKSFLAMSTMRALAGLKKKVVLVDADLRRSYIAAQYGLQFTIPEPKGLAHYLAGRCSMDDILYATDIPNSWMVPVGRSVSNSLSLLNTNRLPVLLEQLASHFDFVLVDAPPVGVIIDAAEIAKSCDGTLLAITYNRVSQRELMSAKQQLEKTGCSIIGAVLNNVEMDSYMNRKYYYKSYYSHYNSSYYRPRKNKKSEKESPTKNDKRIF